MAITINRLKGDYLLSGNPVEMLVTTDAIPAGSNLYRLVALIDSTDGQLGTDTMEAEIAPDANNQSLFNLSELLHKRPVFDFLWPLDGSISLAHPNWVKQVTVDGGESYIDASNQNVKNIAGIDSPLRIFYGKIPTHDWNVLNQQGKSFFSEYIDGCRFLTALPDGQTISPETPVKLWFFPKPGLAEALNLKVEYTLADGTTGTLSFARNITQDQMHELLVDPATLGLDVANVLQYKVWLANGDVAIGEQRTFNVDRNPHENNSYIFYVNRFGVVEVVWFSGEIVYKYNTTVETAERETTPDDVSRDATVIVTKKQGRRSWELNFGNNKSKLEMLALQELLDTMNAWIVDGNYVIPVHDEGGENSLFDTLEDLQNLTLKLTESH